MLRELKRRINSIKLMFVSEWKPSQYLSDYYSSVQPDEIATIKFLVDQFRTYFHNKPKIQVLLEFGVGPTMHHIFAAVPYANEIHMGDFLEVNLKEVRKWLDQDESAHNWDPFIRYTLQCEGTADPSEEDIEKRKQETRKKVKRLYLVDASQENPGGPEYKEHYPVLMTCYCADSATRNMDEWQKYMQNIISMIKNGGTIVTSALYKTDGYRVGDKVFPSAKISEIEMANALGLAFPIDKTTIIVKCLEGHDEQGYHGVLFAAAQNKHESKQIVSMA